TIVLVSLSMVVLVGMAAISVDYAVASSEKATVQNAADAAAIAVATDCALKRTANCNTGSADWMAKQNAGSSVTVSTLKNGVVMSPEYADGVVTVRVQKNVEHTFAPVLGESASSVGSEATAAWESTP